MYPITSSDSKDSLLRQPGGPGHVNFVHDCGCNLQLLSHLQILCYLQSLHSRPHISALIQLLVFWSSQPTMDPWYQQQLWFSSLASVNVANFVATKLQTDSGVSNTNYAMWKEQMLCLIESQGLLEYIDGSISPPLLQHQDYNVWRRIDVLLKGWILGSLTDPIAADVVRLTTARDVWLDLEKKHGPQPIITPIQEVHDIFNKDDRKNAVILNTAIVGGKEKIQVVQNFIDSLDNGKLEAIRDSGKNTPLHIAAAVGNKDAAIILVNKLPILCYKQNKLGDFPIHTASQYAKEDVLRYLISHTKDDHWRANLANPYAGYEGERLLSNLIQAEFFDIALYLVDTYSDILRPLTPNCDTPLILSTKKLHANLDKPLMALTKKLNAFNTKKFNFWERCVSSMFTLTAETSRSHAESSTSYVESNENDASQARKKFQDMLGEFIELLVPRVKEVRYITMANQRATRLLTRMCRKLESLDYDIAEPIFGDAALAASALGVHEVVGVIIKTFPYVLYASGGPFGQYIFHKVIENRFEDVFNLIYHMSDGDRVFVISSVSDTFGNTPFHSAGKLAPSHKLNEISGAALQMQREIQWFEEVKKFANPSARTKMNNNGKTPSMVFTDEHKKMKQEGETWMKDTANSCIIVAALIATVMVTGAVTVPGGNESKTGYPTFAKDRVFIIFAFSNAASLFTSVTSLLFFLAIMTSRYAEKDFLVFLPKRLIFGLSSLFLSIIFMMISYGATLYLVFGQKKQWVLYLVIIFACLPITSFVWLQFPLLFKLISSTCCPGIFGKKSNLPFY